ncbi:MAG: hypothetical protein WCK49_07300 [Myxococcaceae bacterium]
MIRKFLKSLPLILIAASSVQAVIQEGESEKEHELRLIVETLKENKDTLNKILPDLQYLADMKEDAKTAILEHCSLTQLKTMLHSLWSIVEMQKYKTGTEADIEQLLKGIGSVITEGKGTSPCNEALEVLKGKNRLADLVDL